MKKKRILLGIALASASIFALSAVTSCSGGNPDNPGEVESTKATVTFNTNGGGTIEPQEIDKGDKVTRPATDPTKDGFVFLGWYTNAEGTGDPFDFDTAITADITLYAKWKVYDPFEDYVQISTAEELVKFINADASYLTDADKKESTKNIMLTADIDLADVAAEDLVGASIYFKGTFDGCGHVIKNANVNTGTKVKTGILFEQLLGDAVVKNVRFLGCNIKGDGESVAIVAGLCDGDVTFDGIEFNACSVKAGADYAGMLFARNTAVKTINISNITVKNNCSSTCSKYGGLVVGDIVGNSTVNFENLDVNGSFKSSGNGSMVTGRARAGSKISIKNAVVTGKVDSNQLGAVTGGDNALGKLTVENVYANVENADQMFKSSWNSITDKTITNVYSNSTKKEKIDDVEVTKVYADAITVAWLRDTLHLDFTKTWMTEGENNAKYRLVNSSTNVKSATATLSSIYAVTGGAKTRYHKGDDFSTDGVVVMAAYSDGVQLVMQSDEYTLDSTAFDKTAKGTYNIVISATADATKTTDYNVNVVEQTGFELNTLEVTKLYTKGNDFSKDGLGVYSIWSDNVKELEAAPTIDSSTYQKNAAGEYTISVTHGGFTAQTFKVSVVDTAPVVVDSYFYVNVDASATGYSGQKVNGVETFKSLGDAVAYLTAYKDTLGNATKVIRIAAGTYREKVTIGLDNVVLVGLGTNATDTKIVNNAVESTYSIKSKKTFGLDAATVQVNGANFKAENIAIWNDFDYINEAANEASPQGLALTINGDKAVLDNVDLFGNQDTFYVKKGRVYVNNSKIAGNVDFIFGENNGLVYFNQCNIHAVYRGKEKNNGYVTAMRAGRDGSGKEVTPPTYGYIFYKCNFTADAEVNDHIMGLGRPWGPDASVAYMECTFSKAYAILGYKNAQGLDSRWADMSGNSPANAKFVEYKSEGEGGITTAVAGGSILTDAQAANYTAANLFATQNGGVEWSDEFNYTAELTKLATEKTVVAANAITVVAPTDSDTTTADVIDVTVEKKKKFNINFYVSPWNAIDKTYEVVYDNTKLEYDEAAGTVKALVEGSATFVIKQGSIEKTINVTITPQTGFNNVTFMDGDTEIVTTQGHEEDDITFPTNEQLTKTGYQFVRYYEDKDFTKIFTGTKVTDEDITVYACYYQLNVANVEYVSTADALVAAIAANKTIYLTANIDMSTASTPYAGRTDNFTGSVYGFDYVISNWSVDGVSSDSISFFGKTYAGTLSNIQFKDCTLKTDKKYTSILTSGSYGSEVIQNITFDNCQVINKATAAENTYSGLIAGAGNLGAHNNISTLTVKNITVKNSVVTAGQYSGGLFGYANAESITVDGLYGNITFNSAGSSNKNSGGIIGWCKNYTFTLKNANIAITVNNTNGSSGGKGAALGGVIGGQQYDGDNKSSSVIVESSKLTITMNNAGSYCGGIIGQDSLQTDKDSDKNVTAVHNGTSNLTISDSSITFDINCMKSSQCVGGVIGRTQAMVANVTMTNVQLQGTIDAGDFNTTNYDSNTKNYAAILGNCGSSTTVLGVTDKVNNTNNLSFTNVKINSLTVVAYTGTKANTIVANTSGNGPASTATYANVSYVSSAVSVKLGTDDVTPLQGTAVTE